MTFAEPTGLFSGLGVVVEACVVGVPALSPLSFLGERHSLAQWPSLPQLWHLPLRRRCLPSSEAVAARASSVGESFLPPWAFPRRLFNRSASSQIWFVRASMLMDADWFRINAEERSCDANVASSLGIPFSIVLSYSLSVIVIPAAANSSFL